MTTELERTPLGPAPAPTKGYLESRLKEGGLKLVLGSPTMLSDEFARFEAERLAAASSEARKG